MNKKIKFHKNILTSVLILLAFSTCELPVDWELEAGDNGALVIEAIITNEVKIQEVKLSLSYDDFNDEPTMVSSATVKLYDGQTIVEFFEDPAAPGVYQTEDPFGAGVFKGYLLEVVYDGVQYVSEATYMVPVVPFPTITFSQVGETDSLRIEEVASIYGVAQQAMYEINIDWRHLSNEDNSQARVFYYTFTTVDAGQVFSPPKEDIIFPKGSKVIEKKYSLNPDFAEYIRALVIETQWQGGVYEENSGNLPTNFKNGALGYFGLCAVLSDTLIAE
jgi:hypothetical protein